MPAPKPSPDRREINASLIASVCDRLARNKRVRRTLPERGRLHVDRQLPFLCVYRRPPGRDDAGTDRLVKGEASYLIAPGGAKFHEGVSSLTLELAQTLSDVFGAFLIVELWADPDTHAGDDPTSPAAVPTSPAAVPTFTIHAPRGAGMTRTVEALEKRLGRIRIFKREAAVRVVRGEKGHPPRMRPLLDAAQARRLRCETIGLAVPPVYRDSRSGQEFPLVMRRFRRRLGLALRQTYFEFARSHTTHRPAHYHELGRRAVVQAVWTIDRQLARVSNAFDYLLQLTPINVHDAFRQFRRERFQRAPDFYYRPLAIDPGLLKRELYKIPIERVEDPALQQLFREKQEELDLKITMLRDRDTPRFLHESLQLFGPIDDDLLASAAGLLARLPRTDRRGAKSKDLDAHRFARLVEEECGFYRGVYPEFAAQARVRDDVSGLIVSRGHLLIGRQVNIPPARVAALLAHEVGTHLLTYYNGKAQPLQQLYSGLAGYEGLQEGLAVLAEYLVGGMSPARMRELAARVVAVGQLIGGASFVETFRTLEKDHGFTQRGAYAITARVYRSGGLTKDAVYLRGLQAILRYVCGGGDLAPLFVGKIAEPHIPIIQELQYRKVLRPAPIPPRYLRDPQAVSRLERLRGANKSLLDLV